MNLETLYHTSLVTRYGSRPGVAHLSQTTGQHSHGMLVLLYMMHPNPGSELVKAVTFHDSDELFGGDLSYPFKQNYPEAAKAHEELSKEIGKVNGIPYPSLTDEDKRWLKFLDRLEPWLYLKTMRPDILYTPPFVKMALFIIAEAKHFGCYVSKGLDQIIDINGYPIMPWEAHTPKGAAA